MSQMVFYNPPDSPIFDVGVYQLVFAQILIFWKHICFILIWKSHIRLSADWLSCLTCLTLT